MPGLGREGASYLASKQVVAIGSDTWGLEVMPFEKGAGVFEVHQILLAKNGIYILENMDTAELVKDQAWEFMFVLSPSRMTGGVQSIVNPVAIR
jgi:kynurenine formamidase